MDVFYPQLSYTKIEQQEAFSFISLLSEVGGFLGLLLGASVLTVCELIDFLVLVLLRRCRPQPPHLDSQEGTPHVSGFQNDPPNRTPISRQTQMFGPQNHPLFYQKRDIRFSYEKE